MRSSPAHSGKKVLQRAARGRRPATVDQQKRCRGARAADQQMWRRGGRAARGSGLPDRRRCVAAQGSPSPKIRPGAVSSSASSVPLVLPSLFLFSLDFVGIGRFCRSISHPLPRFPARPCSPLDFPLGPPISRAPLDFPRDTPSMAPASSSGTPRRTPRA